MKINYLFSARFIKNTLATITTIAFVFGGIFVPNLVQATTAPVVYGVTQISAVQTYATAGGGFENGWKWVFDVTVPANETVLRMKFADWIGTTDSISTAGNVEFYSDQSTNATSASPILISAKNSLSDPMYINSGIDLNSRKPGRQIQITVEVRVPSISLGGSYSTSYGINTAPDTIPPVITLIGSAATTTEAGLPYTDEGATAFDNVDGVLVPVLSGTVNTSTVGGPYTLTYNVSNSAENAATPVSRSVTVVDTTKPSITAPADITTEATGLLTTVNLGSPIVTDNATPAPTVTNNAPAAGFPVGTTVVTWTATDASNNVSTANQNVTITDTKGPVFSETPDVTVNIDKITSTVVNYTMPTATDVVDGVRPVSCTPNTGSTFPLGDTTVNCSASDLTGHTTLASFVVHVVDNTFPIITITNPDTTPAQSKMITVSTDEGTLTQSVTTGTVCDGSLSFSAYADTTFTLESNNGDSVCYRAVDAANNTTYKMSAVIGGIDRTAPAGGPLTVKTVDHSSGITVSAPTSGVYTITPALKGSDQFTSLSVVVNDTNLNTNPVPVYIDGSTISNGTMVYNGSVWNYTPGTPVVFTEGPHTLAATFSDNVGNTTTLTAQFTTDNTAPTGGSLTVKTVNYPAGITISSPTSGVYTITPPLMGSDQFTSLSLVVNGNDLNTADVPVTIEGSANGFMHYSGSGGIWNYMPGTQVAFTNGPHNLVATFSDNAGNTTKLTAEFVVDNEKPVIVSHADVTQHVSTETSAIVTYDLPTVTDNHDTGLVATCSPVSGSTFSYGDTTVTCSAADSAGNQAIQTTFKVTVADNVPPVLTVAGFTADGNDMPGDMTNGFTLNTENNPANSHTLQFETGSTANENLMASTSGLYLIPSSPAQTAALVAYYSTKPPLYLGYLDGAAAGTMPFAYIKTVGDTSIKILDGAQYTLNSQKETDMIVPDNFPLGTYTVTGQIQDLAGNYTTVTFILKVVGNITITAVTNSKSYDGTTAALATPTINSGALHGSDTANFIETYDTKNVGTGKTLTPSGIVNDGNSGSNYNYTFVNDTTGVITQATTPLVITAKNLTKTYGGTITFAGTEFTESGLATGDSITSVTLTSDGAVSTAPVSGSPYTIHAIGAVGSGLDNYTIQYNAGTLIVNPVDLTATITVNDKQYDGTNSATINTQSLNGVIGSDDVSLTGGTATFDNQNVGNGKAVTISGLSLTGTDARNYTLTQPTGLTASITPAPLVATVTASNKPYDNTTTAATECSLLPGVISPDVITCSVASANFSDVNVGNGKLVTAIGITLAGTGAGNYSVNPTATTNANITARLLTVTATASNKVYDGNTSVGPVTLTTDALPADGITATGVNNGYFFKDRNVGTGKSVQVVGITVSGSLSNYTLSGTNGSITAATTADITARPLTITGLSASNKMYDGTTVATITGTPALVGIQNDPDTHALDIVSLTGTPAGTFADSSVGTGKIVTVSGLSLTGADAGNYTLTATSTTADITPAPVPTTGTATDITATDATLKGTNGPVAADNESFWVSTSTIDTSNANNIPTGVYSTPTLSSVAANGTFSDPLSLVTTSGITTGGVPGNLPSITPDTTYYFVVWANVGETWYHGAVENFTTSHQIISVKTLLPDWTTGVWAAYYSPDSQTSGGVSPGSTALFDGREAGIIEAGITPEPSDSSNAGQYMDEGLLGFQVPSVAISTFAGQALTYDVENQTGANPVWVRIRMTDLTEYQFVPASYGVGGGYHTINAAAGQWYLMDNTTGNAVGLPMTLSQVAANNSGAMVDRVYLTLGMGDTYHVSDSPDVGTVAWVDTVTIGGTTYNFTP
jgi:hypothetical protein